MAHKRLDATVHGRVQGVGFRWFVMRRAERLGLVGWVANEAKRKLARHTSTRVACTPSIARWRFRMRATSTVAAAR